MKKIALLTSGGDCPGMNPAIRAVVRTAIGHNLEVAAIKNGYQGLLEEKFQEMNVSSVGNIIQRGGTILGSSRCLDFHKKEVRKKAAENLRKHNIDGLIVLGGDGSFNGAAKLSSENNIAICGVPCTIDNDISGTQYSLGFDTAVQNAVEAVDKIRDTAASHNRTFIVEVMGRNSAAIATHVGVCTGAEDIIFPDEEIDFKSISDHIHKGIQRGKNSSILIVAEGQTAGRCYEISQQLKDNFNIPSHICILGHIQRGGTPSSLDRFIASAMGFSAVKALLEGKHRHVTAFVEGYTSIKPIEECLNKKTHYEQRYRELAQILSI